MDDPFNEPPKERPEENGPHKKSENIPKLKAQTKPDGMTTPSPIQKRSLDQLDPDFGLNKSTSAKKQKITPKATTRPSDLADDTAANAGAEAQLREVRKELDKLRGLQNSHTTTIDSLNENLDISHKKIDAAQAISAKTQAELIKAQTELDEARNRLGEVQVERDDARKKLSEAQPDLDEARMVPKTLQVERDRYYPQGHLRMLEQRTKDLDSLLAKWGYLLQEPEPAFGLTAAAPPVSAHP